MKKLSEWNSIKIAFEMYKRVILRSIFMIVLLLTAGFCLDHLTTLSRNYGYDFAGRYPELLVIFRAVAILTWLELSIFWIRLGMAPKTDEQAAANTALHTPHTAAIVYTNYTLRWGFRLVVLLKLCEYW